MKPPVCFLTFLWIVLTAQAALGGVSLKTSAACHLSGERLEVAVTVINVGNEAAANVGITVRLGDAFTKSPAGSELKPGGSLTGRVPLKVNLTRPGTYVVEVLVDFTDRTGRPFSAVAYALLAYEETAAAMIFPQPGRAVVRDAGVLRFEVINVDPGSRQAVVRLVLPRELSATEPKQTISLSGREKKAVIFALKNFAALEGALYPVLALVEYEEGGRHYAAVGESRVQVLGEEKFFKKHQKALMALAILLILIVILIQIFRSPKDA